MNFRNVEYLSSAALGKFITLNKKVGGAEIIVKDGVVQEIRGL